MSIPFFPNTGDGTHCFQAALMMALAVVMPRRKFSYEELDEISGKLPGKWTWPTKAMLWMIDEGLKIKLIEEFDYRAFARRGREYLIERFGEEVGLAQIENSDIDAELEFSRKFAKQAPLEYRIPTIHDIKNGIEEGAVVIVNLNAAVIHNHEGYSGHFVVVTEVGEKEIVLHDPGLPPCPNLKVSLETFDRAWGYPTERDKNLLAVWKKARQAIARGFNLTKDALGCSCLTLSD